jgi:hypothetical protein
MSLTIQNKVINFLTRPNDVEAFYTSAEIGKFIDEKQESVSSILKRMTDKKILIREPGIGKCGGFGYAMKPHQE